MQSLTSQSAKLNLHIKFNTLKTKLQYRGNKKILTVELSTKQAKDFAYSIFADIGEYIKTHQAEYDEYLKKEGLTNEK